MILIKRIHQFLRRISIMSSNIMRIQEALGRIEQRQIEYNPAGISISEFRVFSQWGEDGIIQYLVRHISVGRKVFVEFGVQNYTEANTRFLLTNNFWAGLVMDGSAENIDYIKKDPIYWGYNLKAEHAFITRDNVNYLIMKNGISGDMGLLSVDIDGNDYWVWDAITCVEPRIVVCEYNSLFGPFARVTIPYDPMFVRDKAHFSKVYYGASIAALCELADRKGYSLVAANSAGNNAFFVRNDVLGELKVVVPGDVYRRAQFREYHDQNGKLTFYDFETARERIKHLEVYDVDSKKVRKFEDIPKGIL